LQNSQQMSAISRAISASPALHAHLLVVEREALKKSQTFIVY
jgi:hypothetical protein